MWNPLASTSPDMRALLALHALLLATVPDLRLLAPFAFGEIAYLAYLDWDDTEDTGRAWTFGIIGVLAIVGCVLVVAIPHKGVVYFNSFVMALLYILLLARIL